MEHSRNIFLTQGIPSSRKSGEREGKPGGKSDSSREEPQKPRKRGREGKDS